MCLDGVDALWNAIRSAVCMGIPMGIPMCIGYGVGMHTWGRNFYPHGDRNSVPTAALDVILYDAIRDAILS